MNEQNVDVIILPERVSIHQVHEPAFFVRPLTKYKVPEICISHEWLKSLNLQKLDKC